MAIETREKEINGSRYTVTQLPARRAIRLKAKLIRILGPVIAQVFVTVTEKKNDLDQKDSIVKAVELLGANLNENDFENTIVEILQGVRKDGVELVPAIIDMEFAGDMASLYQVVWFVLEVNYANFFSMLGIGNQLDEPNLINPVTKKTFHRK